MGTLRQSADVSAHPEQVATWLLQHTARIGEELFNLKGSVYQLARKQIQWPDQSGHYVMQLEVFGPVIPRGIAKRTDWFIQVEIQAGKKRGFSAEAIVSCNIGGDVGRYYGELLTALQKQWPGTQIRYLDSPDDEPGSGWTRSEVVPGSAGHFRATMERLYLQYRSDDGWTSSSGDRLTLGKNVHTDDKRGTWQMALRREDEPPCFAAIEAYEQPNGTTVVEFRDGREPGSQWRASSVGPSFVEFSDVVIREAQPVEIAVDDQGEVFQEIRLRPATDQQSVESEAAAILLQDVLPKRPQTLERYKKAYSIIVELRGEYRQLYEDDETAKPAPSMDDYREALGLRMSWKPSNPVVRKIIELGDEGLLNS